MRASIERMLPYAGAPCGGMSLGTAGANDPGSCMGTSAKTLSRLIGFHHQGLLPAGASIVELGAQELYCTGEEEHLREVVRYFHRHLPSIRDPDAYRREELVAFADRGMLGGLLAACGFRYLALDIFDAPDTRLFDLNVESPGDDLAGRFDLVTNYGTTEHVVNQYLSMKTMHELARPGGLIHHDLPMAGYHDHGYFCYNPRFFTELAEANGYEIVFEAYSRSAEATRAPDVLMRNGFPEARYHDAGIEFAFRKGSDAPFRLPLETSTSLGLDARFLAPDSGYWNTDGQSLPLRAGRVPDALARAPVSVLHRELLHRYRQRLRRLLRIG